MESASSRPVLTSLASIAFSLAVVFLFLAVRGIWPFGGRFLEYMDNGQLVYPTLKYYASALMSGAFDGAFFYDVNGGAGIRVSPTLPHQLLIPSTWIAVAMGDSFLLKDMVWVMLADVACICVTASWFLRRVFPSLPVCWTVLLTAGYAVGGFFQTKYGFMQFLDHAAMFPLFALGLYRLVNGGRGWLYAAGLFLLRHDVETANGKILHKLCRCRAGITADPDLVQMKYTRMAESRRESAGYLSLMGPLAFIIPQAGRSIIIDNAGCPVISHIITVNSNFRTGISGIERGYKEQDSGPSQQDFPVSRQEKQSCQCEIIGGCRIYRPGPLPEPAVRQGCNKIIAIDRQTE